MKYIFLTIVIVLQMQWAYAVQIQGLDEIFEISSQDYLSKYSLRFKNIHLKFKKISDDFNTDYANITIHYLNSKGQSLYETHSRVHLRNCYRAQLGEYCAKFEPELHWALNPWTCFLSFEANGSKQHIQWGECRDQVHNPFASDLEMVFNQSDFSLQIHNKGMKSSSNFRVLIEYLDHRNQSLVYVFKSIEMLRPKDKVAFSLTENFYDWFSCKVKVTLDPDGSSGSLMRKDHMQVIQFGECSGEEFIPYNDFQIVSAIKSHEDQFVNVWSVIVKNSGDLPVANQSLEILVRGLSQDHKDMFVFKQLILSALAPSEYEEVRVSVPKHLEGLCFVEVTLRTSSTLEELNLNNNKILINLCES